MSESDVKEVLAVPEEIETPPADAPAQDNRPAPPLPKDSDDPVTDCPVIPLGKRAGKYFFVAPDGEIREMSQTPLTKAGGLGDLFCGDINWLAENFPDTGNRKRNADTFHAESAGLWLMAACHKKGLVKGDFTVRTLGMWRSKISDRLIVHCGDRILMDGRWHLPGLDEYGVIYGGEAPIRPPAEEAADRSECQMLLEYLQTWHWENMDLCPEIALGLLGQAFLAGALEWKAHGMIYGEGGSGKTTLGEFFEAAMGSAVHEMVNNFTEASMRQDMDRQARSFLLDEAEADSITRNISAVIELTRQMSRGDGAKIGRGSAGGGVKKYRLNGAAVIFCINAPFLQPQDRMRWTRMRLLKHRVTAEDAESGADVKAMLSYLRGISGKLWRRAVDSYQRYHDSLDRYSAAMAELGVDHRARDQAGAVLAGRDIFARDDVPTMEEARADVMRFMDYLIRQHWPEDDDSASMECLGWLTSSRAHTVQRDLVKTVGQLLADVAVDGSSKEVGALEALGIKFEQSCRCKDSPLAGKKVLFISNRHSGMRQIFRGSKWENGSWPEALKGVPGAYSPRRSFRFAGSPAQKAIGIPYELLQDKIEDAAAAAENQTDAGGVDADVPF